MDDNTDGPHFLVKHISLGTYYLWVDATGDLRIKNGAPSSDTDAGSAIVGTQS